MPGKPWTTVEVRSLHRLYRVKSAGQLAPIFKRSLRAIQQKAKSEGILRTARERSLIWSESTKRVPRGCVLNAMRAA